MMSLHRHKFDTTLLVCIKCINMTAHLSRLEWFMRNIAAPLVRQLRDQDNREMWAQILECNFHNQVATGREIGIKEGIEKGKSIGRQEGIDSFLSHLSKGSARELERLFLRDNPEGQFDLSCMIASAVAEYIHNHRDPNLGCRPVWCCELGKKFISRSEAGRFFRCGYESISQAVKNRGAITGGYHFENYDPERHVEGTPTTPPVRENRQWRRMVGEAMELSEILERRVK